MQTYLMNSFDQSGIPFQQWCAAYVRTNENAKFWKIEREEYPVAVGGKETRVDFIATARNGSYELIVECKLANHQYKTWLFSKSFDQPLPQLFTYQIEKNSHNTGYPNKPPCLGQGASNFYKTFELYQSIHGLEIKTNQQGHTGREKNWALDPIQNIGYQSSLSCFGLIKKRWDQMEKGRIGKVSFFSVVFTMAELKYISFNPLKTKIPSCDRVASIPWIVYHYSVSDLIWEGMGHRVSFDYADKTIPILIINVNHMDTFFDTVTKNLELFL